MKSLLIIKARAVLGSLPRVKTPVWPRKESSRRTILVLGSILQSFLWDLIMCFSKQLNQQSMPLIQGFSDSLVSRKCHVHNMESEVEDKGDNLPNTHPRL